MFSIAGLFAILVSAVFLTEDMRYPGWLTLLPVFGAVALITGRETWVNRTLLSMKGVVTLGLLSYTLYLWHWPVLAVSRILNGGTLPDYGIRIALVLLGLVLSAVSFYVFELPIRRKVPSKKLVAVLSAVMLGMAGIGLAIKKTDGLPQRLPKADVDFSEQLKNSFPSNNQRGTKKYDFDGEWINCYLSDDKPASIAVIGDSHAHHLMSGLTAEWTRLKNPPTYLLFTVSATPPLLDIWRSVIEPEVAEKGALPSQTYALNMVLDDPDIRTVILSSRWTNFILNDDYTYNWKNKPELNPRNIKQRPKALEFFLDKTLSALAEARKNVVIAEDVPVYPFTPGSCKRPFRKIKDCTVSRSDFERAAQETNRILESVAKRYPNVQVYQAWKKLCDEKKCYMVKDGVALYRDKDHLTDEGSRRIAEGIVNILTKANGIITSANKPQSRVAI
jgi:hypothetical protein